MSDIQRSQGLAVAEPRPLVVSDDADVIEEVLRLAAAADAEVLLHPTPGAARQDWRTAPAVLLGHDALVEAIRLRMPRRGGLSVITRHDEPEVYRMAMSLGAEQVVVLPDDEQALVEWLADAVEAPEGAGPVVCVVGGRGGAGASITATALALTAMRMGGRPLLVDADPLGGGIDLVVGGEDTEGLRWPDLAGTKGRLSGAALRSALPAVDHLTLLSWDRGDELTVPPEAMRAVLAAAARSSDVVVVDLPRRVDDAAAAALARATVTLLVVPAEVRAVASATRVLYGIRQHAADIRLLVRGPAPSGLPTDVIAGSLGLSVAGTIHAEPGIEEAVDRGEAPVRRRRGPLASFCCGFLQSLESERSVA